MSNCVFGWPIYSDVISTVYTPAFSGGNWTLPLTNLQDRRMGVVARSASAAIADTLFTVDLGVARRVGVIAIPRHTISQVGTIRLRGFSTVPCFDSLTAGDGTWSTSSTLPARTAAAFTCADGTPLDLLNDNSAGVIENTFKAMAFTGNGTKAIRFRFKKSSSFATQRFYLSDGTAVVDRLALNIDNTGATPVATIVGGIGTIVSMVDNGDTTYDILVTAPGVVAANVNNFSIWPAGTAVASDTAAIYVGSIMAWNAATDQLVYNGGVITVWPVVYPPGSLPADDPRMVTGKYSAEEATLVTMSFTHVLSTPKVAQYWRLEIFDSTNAAGHVDLSRLTICDAYQPSRNLTWGYKLGVITATTRNESDGSTAIFNVKRTRRTEVFTIDDIGTDEALANIYEMLKRIGISGQLYFVFDPVDTYHMHRRSMLCVLQQLTALEYAYFDADNIPWALIEEL